MSKEVQIRPLAAEDAEGFRRIMTAFYQYAGNELPVPEDLDRLFAKAVAPETNLLFLIAVAQREPVGILSLTFGESSYRVAPFAWCDDFYVEAAWRGAGIGRRLLDEAEIVAVAKGCSNILLGVGEKEDAAQAFYGAYGFVDMNCKLLTLPLH